MVRSLSSSCRMRSVFSRIALMLRNINLGGAFSGIRSNSRPKSRPLERDARRLATTAAPVTAAPLISSFFALVCCAMPLRTRRLSFHLSDHLSYFTRIIFCDLSFAGPFCGHG